MERPTYKCRSLLRIPTNSYACRNEPLTHIRKALPSEIHLECILCVKNYVAAAFARVSELVGPS